MSFCRKNSSRREIIDPRRVFVKPNFTWDSGIEPLPYDKREGFIYVGRLEKIKGIDLLLHAWAEMKKEAEGSKVSEQNVNRKTDMGCKSDVPHLIICGTGPLETYCRRYVKNHHLMDVVEFAGQISHEEVMKRMAKVKALVVSSRIYESFSMTTVEALSLGTPVIVPEQCNAANIVQDAKDGALYGIKSKINSIGLKHCISKLLKNEEPFYPEIIQEFFLNNYSPEENYTKLNCIYHVDM